MNHWSTPAKKAWAAWVLLLAASLLTLSPAPAWAERNLLLLYANDLHGELAPCG